MKLAMTEQIIRDVEALPEDKQRQVAIFIKSLSAGVAFQGMTGKEAVKLFAGLIDKKSAWEMATAIEEGCEAIDAEGW